MTATRILLAVVPPLVMIAIALMLPGIEQWLATFGKTAEAKLTLGRIGLALPYVASAAIALIFLLSAQGSVNIKTAGWGGVAGSVAVIALAIGREGIRLSQFAGELNAIRSILSYIDPATMTGATAALFSGIFARRAVKLLDTSETKEILRLYQNDDGFHAAVNQFIHDFEAMLRLLIGARDGSAISVTLLSSDIGKLYVALAQAIDRLRN